MVVVLGDNAKLGGAVMTAALAAPGQAFERVRAVFENLGAIRVRGDRAFMTSCPLHEDRSPSLSVRWKPARAGDAGGAVFLKCFSCNATADYIAKSVGLTPADLFDNPLPQITPAHARRSVISRAPVPAVRSARTRTTDHDDTKWRRVRVYTYTDSAGQPVQQVIRQECTCEAYGTHKRFIQAYRDGRRWVWQAPEGFTPVLYRARQLAAAPADAWVWLTEGEKDAETAARMGVVATTNANGSAGYAATLLDPLAGRKVAIVVDRDRAGYDRAATLHAQLSALGTHTVILLPDVDAAKADLTDHVNAGRWDTTAQFGGMVQLTADELEALRDSAEGHR